MPRVAPVGIPQHVIQRGNNRQVCFASEQDCNAYLDWLKEYAEKYQVAVHAWVLMTNHVHLLVTPNVEGGVSKMMQSVGRQYVRYFNHSYRRTGTLWEGRYKSCLVQTEDYLLGLYRYIELNPVRAGMVEDPADYKWSSYRVNALGSRSELCTPHERYLALGADEAARLRRYRELFAAHVDKQLLEEIRGAVNKGLILGNDRFKQEVERMTGLLMIRRKPGRPRKNEFDG